VANIQFAVNPDNGRMIVIENEYPRVSRSSALASTAKPIPIATNPRKTLAVGYRSIYPE